MKATHQSAITETLSDMDAEITALEEKLSKAAPGQAGHDVRVADGEG